MDMNRYTIYCTPEQTKKALELGAPIRYACIKDIGLERYVYVGDKLYTFPTTDQMINWLEAQENGLLCINVVKEGTENGHYMFIYYLRNGKTDKLIKTFGGYSSRKEATLAAIDAALEYLNKNTIKNENN